MQQIRLSAATLLLLILLNACSKSGALKKEETSGSGTTTLNVNDPLVKQILAQGFHKDQIVEYKNYYLVEGDISFPKNVKATEAAKVQTEHVRSRDLVKKAYWNFNLYFDAAQFIAPAAVKEALSLAINDAITSFNNAGSGMRITRTEDFSQALIAVYSTESSTPGEAQEACAYSGFPVNYDDNKPFPFIYANIKDLLNTDANTVRNKFAYRIAHQLGHCVGLRHNNWEEFGETLPAFVPTPTDFTSIMYGGSKNGPCGRSWAQFPGLSLGDKEAMKALYPVHYGEPYKLNSGDTLKRNAQLRSEDGRFTLRLQNDGKLVLRYYNTVLWDSRTNNTSISYAVMQADGNFVLYNDAHVAFWSTVTFMYPGSTLQLQSDGNLVVYQGAASRWASQTHGW